MGDEPDWKHVEYILRCYAGDAYQDRDQALARAVVGLKARVEHLEGRLMCQGVVIDRIVARVEDLERRERARDEEAARTNRAWESLAMDPSDGEAGVDDPRHLQSEPGSSAGGPIISARPRT